MFKSCLTSVVLIVGSLCNAHARRLVKFPNEAPSIDNINGEFTNDQLQAYIRWNQRVGPAVNLSSLLEVERPTPEDIKERENYRLAPVWTSLLASTGKKVGAGTFGTTFIARSACAPNETVAVKQVVGDSWSTLSKEIIIQSDLDHAHVARVFDYYPRKRDEWDYYYSNTRLGRKRLFSIMMELLPGGELLETMLCGMKKVPCTTGEGCANGNKEVPTSDACKGTELPFADIGTRKKYIAETGIQLLRGIEYIHSRGIAHRDLKGENVMYVGGDCVRNPSDCQVKIIDFGLACNVRQGDRACVGASGTPMFIPPDVYQGANAPYAHDLFSLGMMLFQMWHAQYKLVRGIAVSTRPGREGKQEHPYWGSFPWDLLKTSPDQMAKVFRDNWITSWDPNMPPLLKNVVESLLRVDSKNRVGVNDALRGLTRFYEEDAFAEKSPDVFAPVIKFRSVYDPKRGWVRQQYQDMEKQTRVRRVQRNDARSFPATEPPACIGQCVAKQCDVHCHPSSSQSEDPYCYCPSPLVLGSNGRGCYSEKEVARATCHCSSGTNTQSCPARFQSCDFAGVEPYCNGLANGHKLPACTGKWVSTQELAALQAQSTRSQQNKNEIQQLYRTWLSQQHAQCGRWTKGALCHETGPDGKSFRGSCQAVLMERVSDFRWHSVPCTNKQPPRKYAKEGRCDVKDGAFLEMYECLPRTEGAACTSGKYYYSYTTKLDMRPNQQTNGFIYDFETRSDKQLPPNPVPAKGAKGAGCGPHLLLHPVTGIIDTVPMICADKHGRSLDEYGPGFRGVCMKPQ